MYKLEIVKHTKLCRTVQYDSKIQILVFVKEYIRSLHNIGYRTKWVSENVFETYRDDKRDAFVISWTTV